MFTLSSTEVWNYFTGDRRVAAPLPPNFFYDRMGNATVSTVIRVKWLSSWNRIQPVQILYEGKRLHSITISNWYQRILNHLSCQMILGKVRLKLQPTFISSSAVASIRFRSSNNVIIFCKLQNADRAVRKKLWIFSAAAISLQEDLFQQSTTTHF